MASEPAKSSNPGAPEHLQPHPIVTYPPQQYGGQYPPPVPYPPYYTYAAVPDGSHDPNAANGAPPPPPYFMALPPPPPGMVYAYPAPPPGQAFPPYQPQMQPTPSTVRPKRKQVKMACTNCATACKRCDEARPCERCVKYGIADTCIDGVRKERKKGVKRGPYKRKSKTDDPPTSGETSAPPPAPYPAPPESYYPYVYPHPYVPPPHDGQPHPEGVPGAHVPHPPYYPGYPVYAPYPPYPGAPPMPYPPPTMAPPPAPPASKPPEPTTVAPAEVNGNVASKNKKRSRVKSNEDGGARGKKAKHAGDFHADGEAPRAIVQGDTAPVYANDASRTMVAV
ncbi:uncharacterized protein C8Q71DRAFT_858118 [Rhodofomes roseus]|uniref:Transcription activator of gluconeogenesis ERT1 n=1 Tax=Rhodofomes roseus TaxID=34475 RepID=A0ABQ8KF15_9APHY|nr:uncharacterized protein C8Q71DRAFT_858118 [Rhodofomes roseus]KAH9836105.1 hypothetical protein C8Q71DRAFT_858118 [Rhodofomes roseus]